MSGLKAIETSFKGFKFRSRLEARWAVFFEEMGMDWTYETEGFHLPSGVMYLPDFFIKGEGDLYDYWYEVKPRNSKECPKVVEFKTVLTSSDKNQDIYQLNGDPWDVVKDVCPRCLKVTSEDLTSYGEHEIWEVGELKINVNAYNSYSCVYCDMTQYAVNEGFLCDFRWHKGIMVDFKYENTSVLKYMTYLAKLKAREARFSNQTFVNPFRLRPEHFGKVIE